ncbi:STAS domain-containing protein [Micromonospora haikouensis]|uniref:STAS domain-containing protein n=1 Tax=Micromonospora haikouensis TaxID=686309 RepID=UPI00343E9020
MPAPLLTIEVSRPAPGRARLRLAGELDYDTAPELVEAADRLRRDGCTELEIDLGGITLCDSSGLSALVVIHRNGTGPIRLTGTGGTLQQLLDRTGLAEVLATGHGSSAAADAASGTG